MYPHAWNVPHIYRSIDLNISLSDQQDRELVNATSGAEAEPSRSRADAVCPIESVRTDTRKWINHVKGVLCVINRFLFLFLFTSTVIYHIPSPPFGFRRIDIVLKL